MTVTILPGTDKNNNIEPFEKIELKTGEMYALCGNTGAGKSRLIKDIEMMVNKDSVTNRQILIDGKFCREGNLIAHLGQNMRFVLDMSVDEFISMHLNVRSNTGVSTHEVVALANTVTNEKIKLSDNLQALSGGQSRALMIADIALVCNSPIVLIDEIENAGIDKTAALSSLLCKDKLVLIVTHEPHTILMAKKRIILANGAIKQIVERTVSEEALLKKLDEDYRFLSDLRNKLRKGQVL